MDPQSGGPLAIELIRCGNDSRPARRDGACHDLVDVRNIQDEPHRRATEGLGTHIARNLIGDHDYRITEKKTVPLGSVRRVGSTVAPKTSR